MPDYSIYSTHSYAVLSICNGLAIKKILLLHRNIHGDRPAHTGALSACCFPLSISSNPAPTSKT